ncbi:NAD(P)/FAD-dependent oxidoreductase [Candidatus Saccharibacteria bacterium]|nr:NAD(P)/FAD-dependent oxidoreductase [Candidatus Saccharibacteria bacterium]
MGKKYDFDYIIIGSGPAGSTMALKLAKKTKKRVAMIESHIFGGSNLNTRDIPYAVSLGFSHTFAKLSNYPEIGGQELHYNFPTVVSHQEHTTSLLAKESFKKFDSTNITCISGQGQLIDEHTVAVGKKQYTTANFILATGSKLDTGKIIGLDSVNYLTPDTALKVRRLPKFALIVGGGPTGCEIAEYFAELGAKVIIMESASRLLPKEDEEVSEAITEYFTTELGIMVTTNSKVVALEQDNISKRVIFSTNHQEKFVRIDCVVLATGTKPYTDYGLENANVKYGSDGIIVNKFFQTSSKNIYAVGDAIGGGSSTELAKYQASLLASNLIEKTKNYANYKGFIRLVNTYPEIATIGSTEAELNKQKIKHKKIVVYLKELPASKTERLDYGFIKFLTDHNNHILGATIVAPNAGLMAEEISIAIRHRLTALEIASTPHIANSFNYAIKLAAKRIIKK